MKFIVFLFSLIFFNLSFAGNGVVVGDGNPIDLTKQIQLNDLGEVEDQLKTLIEKMTLYTPELAYIYNYGLNQIKNKKISLVYLPEYSDNYYAFIKDNEIEIDKNGRVKLIKMPTIYFFKNYFDIKSSDNNTSDEISKLEVVVHELSHLFFGDDELKIQRITSLIMIIDRNNVNYDKIDSLKKETSFITEKSMVFSRYSNGRLHFDPRFDLGLKYQSINNKDDTSLPPRGAYMPTPPKIMLNNSFDVKLKNLVLENIKLIFSHYKYYDEWNNLMYNEIDLFQFDFGDTKLSEVSVLQFLLNNRLINFDENDVEIDPQDQLLISNKLPDFGNECLTYSLMLLGKKVLLKKIEIESILSMSPKCISTVQVNDYEIKNTAKLNSKTIKNRQILIDIFEQYRNAFKKLIEIRNYNPILPEFELSLKNENIIKNPTFELSLHNIKSLEISKNSILSEYNYGEILRTSSLVSKNGILKLVSDFQGLKNNEFKISEIPVTVYFNVKVEVY